MQFDLEMPLEEYRSGSVRAVGTGYHAGLEHHYLGRMEGRDGFDLAAHQDMAFSVLHDEVERAEDRFIWDDKAPTFDAMVEMVGSMLAYYFEDGHAWPSDWEILGVEERFEMPFYTAHVKTGTIDLVLRDPNGWVYGVDHKTAGRRWDQHKHKPRKNNQAPFYTAALQELYPDASGHRFVFDVMTYKGEFERRISDPQPEHLAATEDKAIQVIALYEGMRKNGLDLPTNASSTLCSSRYCDHFSYCPAGEVLDTGLLSHVQPS